MSDLDLLLLAISVFAVVLILAAEARRGRDIPSATLRRHMVVVRILLGILFLILGVIGGFVPILQGWVFILLGVLVLFPQSKFAIKAIDKIEPKLPRLVRWLHRIGVGVHR